MTSPRNLVEEDSQGGTLVSRTSIGLDENRAAFEIQNALEAGRDAGAPRLATLDPPLTKTAATAPKQAISYLPALDGLRAISILLVLGFHSIGPASAQIGKFFNGWVGVDVFFVISGYLITSILLKESSQNADGSFSLKKFYIRRSLRIAPAYYTFLLVALAFQCWTGNLHAAPYMYAAFYLTNLNMAFDWGLIPLNIGLNHLWSLAMEEQFYLLWPASLRVLKQHATTAVAGIIAAVYFWRIYLVESGAPWLRLTAGFDTKLDTIMLGVLLALLFVNKSFRDNVGKLFGSTFAQIALFALTAISFAWLGHPQDGGKSGQLLFWALKMPASLGLICLSICSILTAPYGLVSKFLSNPIAVWIGRLSYSIYLWHMLVHGAFCLFFPAFIAKHSALAELTQFALIIAVSASSYYIVEQPFLKLKSRFS